LATVEKNEFYEIQHQPECAVENGLTKTLDNGQADKANIPRDHTQSKER